MKRQKEIVKIFIIIKIFILFTKFYINFLDAKVIKKYQLEYDIAKQIIAVIISASDMANKRFLRRLPSSGRIWYFLIVLKKFPVKIVCNTINFSNFVSGKSCRNFLFILLILSYKDNKNQPTYQIFLCFSYVELRLL
jgi:hypothetical protein